MNVPEKREEAEFDFFDDLYTGMTNMFANAEDEAENQKAENKKAEAMAGEEVGYQFIKN